MKFLKAAFFVLFCATTLSAQTPMAQPPSREQMTPAERAEYDAAPPESKRTIPPGPRSLVAAADPTTQPLIQAGNMRRLGSIFLPSGVGSPNALSVDGNILLVGCYGGGKTGVAALEMPAIGGTAKLISGCSQLPNIATAHMGGTYTDFITSGIIVWNGRLNVGATAYYDGSSGQTKSQWFGTATSQTGPFAMVVSDVGMWTDNTPRYKQSFVGGFKGFIAPEWRTLYGGPAFSGGCCFPIIFGRSLGPSISVYNPDHVGVVDPVPSKMAIGFPYEHPNLGRWEDSPPSPYYGGTDQMGSVAFPSGTRSILFTSRHGDYFCYGPATADKSLVGTPAPPPSVYKYCYDPFDAGQGNHGPPYRPIVTAFDAADVLKVVQGLIKPWDVQPYAKWALPDLPLDRPWYLRAGWWDESRKWYLVGDTSSNEVQIFTFDMGVPVDRDCIKGTDRMLSEVSGGCVAGVETFTQTWTRDGDIAAVGNGAACVPAIPFTRTRTADCAPPPPTVTTVISGTIYTCRVTVSAPAAPSTETGWSVQFRRRPAGGTWVSHGTPDTSATGGWLKGPYTVARGIWEAEAIWTRNGVSLPSVPAAVNYNCQE